VEGVKESGRSERKCTAFRKHTTSFATITKNSSGLVRKGTDPMFRTVKSGRQSSTEQGLSLRRTLGHKEDKGIRREAFWREKIGGKFGLLK
jgi:hypothetical protein